MNASTKTKPGQQLVGRQSTAPAASSAPTVRTNDVPYEMGELETTIAQLEAAAQALHDQLSPIMREDTNPADAAGQIDEYRAPHASHIRSLRRRLDDVHTLIFRTGVRVEL